MESERFIGWAVAPDKPSLGVIKPFDGKPATVGNGTMIALVLDSNAKVDALHRKALSLGGEGRGCTGTERDVGLLRRVFS